VQRLTKSESFMKKTICSSIVAGSLLAVAQTVSAQTTLLTDNFLVDQNVNANPNFEISNGRQGGTQATSPYTITAIDGGGNGVQLGNTSTDAGQPGAPGNSQYMLLAFSSGVQNNLAFNNSLVNNSSLSISFNLYTGSSIGDSSDWMSFTMSQAGNNFVTAAPFGFLVRNNGGVQVFDHGVNVLNEGPGSANGSLWSVTLSDAAGTGSAFAGNGTKISLYNGASLVDTLNLSSGLDASGDELGFFGQSTMIGGVGNLSVVAAPEPSTIALASIGLGLLALRRRARRE
jgi:hypothetical protein